MALYNAIGVLLLRLLITCGVILLFLEDCKFLFSSFVQLLLVLADLGLSLLGLLPLAFLIAFLFVFWQLLVVLFRESLHLLVGDLGLRSRCQSVHQLVIDVLILLSGGQMICHEVDSIWRLNLEAALVVDTLCRHRSLALLHHLLA